MASGHMGQHRITSSGSGDSSPRFPVISCPSYLETLDGGGEKRGEVHPLLVPHSRGSKSAGTHMGFAPSDLGHRQPCASPDSPSLR